MENKEPNNEMIIYEGDNGVPRIEVILENETVWLTMDQMAELFDKSRSTINEHILNIYIEKELNEKQNECIMFLNAYYIKTRYTEDLDVLSKQLNKKKSSSLLLQTQGISKWLKQKVK